MRDGAKVKIKVEYIQWCGMAIRRAVDVIGCSDSQTLDDKEQWSIEDDSGIPVS